MEPRVKKKVYCIRESDWIGSVHSPSCFRTYCLYTIFLCVIVSLKVLLIVLWIILLQIS